MTNKLTVEATLQLHEWREKGYQLAVNAEGYFAVWKPLEGKSKPQMGTLLYTGRFDSNYPGGIYFDSE